LHIPPYSPKLNSIENVFGIAKPRYRKSCPADFMTGFNYRDCLKATLTETSSSGFTSFFNKTDAIVADTLSSIAADPHKYEFVGYDD
jgi:hypothetical protein